MNDFIEKWKTDSQFKAKAQLIIFGVFIVAVLVFGMLNGGLQPNNSYFYYYSPYVDTKEEQQEEITSIKILDQYDYAIDIKVNDEKLVTYTGEKRYSKEDIVKTTKGKTINYVYQDKAYYIDSNGEYLLTNKNEVYDIIDYSYIKLETINQYLTKAEKKDNKYIVYLKDIILGNESEDYITIELTEEKTTVDYTALMKSFDDSVESYLVEISISEIE